MATNDKLVIGFDCSTQSLKATVINLELEQVEEFTVNYNNELPSFKTKDGVVKHDDGSITSPTLMWVAALDLILSKMKSFNLPFEKVIAISGSGQQHGSVFWKTGARKTLASFDSSLNLTEQCKELFSVEQSPIWMDSTTTEDCNHFESLLGGSRQVAELTGSVAYERFTIHQIRKIARLYPTDYKNTERISLVSSFIGSLFIGDYCPIDAADGSGMNAMNLRTKQWLEKDLLTTYTKDESILEKLGPITDSYKIAGTISRYFVQRYGFASECLVVNCSGDNPCSLAGVRMRRGDIAISLGTSDTMFGPLKDPAPSQEGHVFCDPVHPDGYMALLCYINGSLTREIIRNKYAHSDWDTFNQLISQTPPGNHGNIGIYYEKPEITPRAPAGFHRFNANDKQIDEFDNKESNVRAIIESQFLSMLLHSDRIGLKPSRIFATGGASKNKSILKIMSDVFGVPVYCHSQPNSASLGAAYRALHGWKSRDQYVSFDDIVNSATPFILEAEPDHQAHQIYQNLLHRYRKLESTLVYK